MQEKNLNQHTEAVDDQGKDGATTAWSTKCLDLDRMQIGNSENK